jgi:hypothetical protein
MAIRQRRREEPAVEYAFWGGYWDWEALRVKGVKAGLEIWFERVLEVIRRQSTEIRPRSLAPLKRRFMIFPQLHSGGSYPAVGILTSVSSSARFPGSC